MEAGPPKGDITAFQCGKGQPMNDETDLLSVARGQRVEADFSSAVLSNKGHRPREDGRALSEETSRHKPPRETVGSSLLQRSLRGGLRIRGSVRRSKLTPAM